MSPRGKKITIAFVLPVYNEEKILLKFHSKLQKTIIRLKDSYTFLFLYVNDCSTDSSPEILAELKNTNKNIEILSFSRNQGHQAALWAGLKSKFLEDADAVITMDTDLEDPPAVCLDLIAKWADKAVEKGEAGDPSKIRLVLARRSSRDDAFLKKLTATGFYTIFNLISPLKIVPNVGDFRLIDRSLLLKIQKLKPKKLFLRLIFSFLEPKPAIVNYHRPRRLAGKSHYTLRKMIQLAWDGVVLSRSLSQKTLRTELSTSSR